MRRAIAIAALVLAACGPDGDRAPSVPSPSAGEPAGPSGAERPMSAEEAVEAAARWAAIPPPVEASTFDPEALEWRVVPGMAELALERADRVVIVGRTTGGGTACSGSMCSMALDARALRGALPAEHLGYFATDRPPDHLLREGGSDAGLFQDWTVVEIAPRSQSDRPLFCGISAHDANAPGDWVILRVGTLREPR